MLPTSLTQLSYADRLKLARTIRAYYLRDIADFQAYNPVRFTAQWEIDWQAAILAAEAYISDEDVVDQSTSISIQVENLMAEARKLYQRFIKPFVEDAFPNDEGMQNQFGLDDYGEHNRTATKMLAFIQKVHKQCIVHQAALVGVGINPVNIAKLNSLYNDLTEASLEQSTFMGKRMTSAQTRQNLFAVMDEFTAQTCRSGKNIYLDEDMAKYRGYLLPTRTTESSVVHNLPENAKMEVMESIQEEDFVAIENKGTTDFSIYVAESTQGAVPATAVVLAAGAIETYSALELGFDPNKPAPQMLIIWNGHPNTGKFTLDKME